MTEAPEDHKKSARMARPGSLAAYAPQPPPPEEYVPQEPVIMWALGTRPKPYRIVNAQPGGGSGARTPLTSRYSGSATGPRPDRRWTARPRRESDVRR